jgi:hypothetical protein
MLQPQMCVVSGPGSDSFVAGVETYILLHFKDAYFNDIVVDDSATIEVAVIWQRMIKANWYYDYEGLRLLNFNDDVMIDTEVGRISHASTFTRINGSLFNVSYVAFRQGINHLEVYVNGLLIRGKSGNVSEDARLHGSNQVIQITGSFNPLPDGNKSFLLRGYPVDSCTTGVECSLELQLRDAWSNVIWGVDNHHLIETQLVSTACNSTVDEPYPDRTSEIYGECIPIDVGRCEFVVNATHQCTLTPTLKGTLHWRTIVNGVEVVAPGGEVKGDQYLIENKTYGPFAVEIFVGDIAQHNSPFWGPGLLPRGNVVSNPRNITVQLRDKYGNDRPNLYPEAVFPDSGVYAALGPQRLETVNNNDGTGTAVAYVNVFVAGYHQLHVRFGNGCQYEPIRTTDGDVCEHVQGSPTELLYWAPEKVSVYGTYCLFPEEIVPGVVDHFICHARDRYDNRKDDPHVYFQVEMLLIRHV